MQCVRCSHPLPPRADRCLRCFALNPQNRPEPPAASPAVPVGAIAIAPAAMPQRPLELSFESEPPLPGRAEVGAMSIKSDPPPRSRRDPLPALVTPAPELTFDDPSISQPPQRVIDLGDPRSSSPGEAALPPRQQLRPDAIAPAFQRLRSDPIPDTIPDPKPELTPAPMIDLKPRSPAIAPSRAQPDAAAQAPLDRLAQAALNLSDPGLPMLEKKRSDGAGRVGTSGPKAKSGSPDLDGLRALPPGADEPRPQLRARLTAWAFDASVIALVSLLFVGVAAFLLGGPRLAPLGNQSWESWADGLLFAHKLPLLWALLSGALALGYSWLFAALGGRTPGMRIAGLKLLREDGAPLDPVQALWRALIAVPSAALGLFGFLLALVDPRGQTLHDKLSHSLLVVSTGPQRGSTEPL